MTVKKNQQYLILVDLDGTALNKDFRTLNPFSKKILTALKERGHKVCIATGKNYLSAIPFYRELGLDTYLITYNGAYILNPSDSAKEKFFAPISNAIIREIVEDPKIKKYLRDFLIDSSDNETISTSQHVYGREVFFNNNPYVCGDVLKHLGNRDALQAVLEFPSDTSQVNSVISALRKYRSAISFNFISKLKKGASEADKQLIVDKESAVIRIRSAFSNKGTAAEGVSSYYNIPLSRSLAFGDDKNDYEMIRKVGYGIAMANGTLELKALSYEVTEFDNQAGGVGQSLVRFFGLENEFKEEEAIEKKDKN